MTDHTPEQLEQDFHDLALSLKINGRQELFCYHYVASKNGTQSAIKAGYAKDSAHITASKLLRVAKIKTFIDAIMMQAARSHAVMSAEEVLAQYTRIARADVNELIESRRHCCRYCWGQDHQYQWTPAEFQKADEKYQYSLQVWTSGKKTGPEPVEPDPGGGLDFNRTRPPHPECPECNGQGDVEVHIKDSRELSPEAKALFAGVKVTKDGYQVLTESQERALRALAEHHNLFRDHQKAGSGEIHVTISEKDAQL